jgi:hypothetical protein
MGKYRRGSKAYTKEQQLSHENQQLKREIAQLRKRLARIELDRYEQIEKTITEHYQLDNPEEGQKILKKVKDEWLCFKCQLGHLQMIIYNKPDGTFYFRRCDKCSNRTKSQKYSTDIK